MPDDAVITADNEVLATILQLELSLNAYLKAIQKNVCSKHKYGINAKQALILARMPDEGCRVGDLLSARYYTGTNASYNTKSLVEKGFLAKSGSEQDGRIQMITLSAKGRQVKESMLKALGELKVKAGPR